MWITFFSSHAIISYTVRMTRLGHWILVEHSSTNCTIVRHQEKIPKGFSKNHCTIPGCSEPDRASVILCQRMSMDLESQIWLVSFVNECWQQGRRSNINFVNECFDGARSCPTVPCFVNECFPDLELHSTGFVDQCSTRGRR